MNRWAPSGEKAQHPSSFPDQSDTEGARKINNAMMLLIGWKKLHLEQSVEPAELRAGGCVKSARMWPIGANMNDCADSLYVDECETGAVFSMGVFVHV